MIRKLSILIIAVWAGAIFGLLEGLILNISRRYPVLLAPYKLSSDVLWFAPIFDIVIYSLLGFGLTILFQSFPHRLEKYRATVSIAVFIFLGSFSVFYSIKLIHIASAIVLASGVAIVITRNTLSSYDRLITQLGERLIWIPITLLLIIVSTLFINKYREISTYRQLPPMVESSPNVLVIVLDTVRYDRFLKERNSNLTPNIDQLANQGVSYTNAWSTSSWSLPTQASILTGRYPHEHGADWPKFDLSDKYPSLARYFMAQGYVTGAFSGNSAWATPEYLGHDFLRFQVYEIQDFIRRTSYGRIIDQILWKLGYHSAGLGKKAPAINAEVLNFLSDYSDRPYFVYICYMDVNQAFHKRKLNHGFWKPQPPMQDVIEAYDEGLSELDLHVGNLISDLDRMGALENTMIVITSDHGESFGSVIPKTNLSSNDLKIDPVTNEASNLKHITGDHDPEGHGSHLYPEQSHVPLFIIYPNKIPAGLFVEQTVSIRQIPSTIIDVLGMKDSPFIGEPLPVIKDNETEVEQVSTLATLNYYEHHVHSVISGQMLYLKNLGAKPYTEELYDLGIDPLAQNDIATEISHLSKMRRILNQLLEKGTEIYSR